MAKKSLLTALLFCLAFVSLNAQSGGNGTPPRNPIKIKVKVRIKNGGSLIINGGTINNADVIVESGGHLTINNSGTINLSQHSDFKTLVGAIVNINSGKINPHE